jgi:hypothetical protein
MSKQQASGSRAKPNNSLNTNQPRKPLQLHIRYSWCGLVNFFFIGYSTTLSALRHVAPDYERTGKDLKVEVRVKSRYLLRICLE